MLDKFDEFLSSVDLKSYRERYSHIKLVEMDLPRGIQAIRLLYQIYWQERRFISFESFYQEYLSVHQTEVEEFRKKTTMCSDCFYRGLPARIYRTWASIITQIHAGYVAESVFGEGSVKMSEKLDHSGADFQVDYKGETINYQVKKLSYSREVRQSKEVKETIQGRFVDIKYAVPNFEHILKPKQKNGKAYYSDYLSFKQGWLDTGLIRVLPNGFVIFTRKVFEDEKVKIDADLKQAGQKVQAA